MRKAAFIILCLFHLLCLRAQDTIPLPANQKAGELSYTMVGYDPNVPSLNIYYHFVLKMTVECKNGKPSLEPFFTNDLDKPGSASLQYEWIFDSLSNEVHVIDPCLVFDQPPCYRIYYYHVDAKLDFNANGYSAFYPDCCRDYYQNFNYTFNASDFEGSDIGLTWFLDRPKPYLVPTRPREGLSSNTIAYGVNIPARLRWPYNSSPVFNTNSDTILYVCKNTPFSHTFPATDQDGDSLVYSLYPSKVFSVKNNGGHTWFIIQTNGIVGNVSYIEPTYTAEHPLGTDVTMDTKTGMVRGQLHDTGSYVLTVAVFEYRNGLLISPTPHTKDILVKVYDCSLFPTPKAIIPPLINDCTSKTIDLPNNSTPYHPDINWDNNKYLWDLGDGNASDERYPVHTYDTGTYNVRLITMPGYRCADTAYTKLVVYPALRPSFTINGTGCTGQTVKFANTSSTGIGMINSLTWSFTNLKDSTAFTSQLSTPTYTFKVPDQTYAAILDVTTTKGCEAKDTQYVDIRQSPQGIITHDTIISTGVPYKILTNSGYDTTGSSYVWSPSTGLDNIFSANPIATGTQDITYKVQVTNLFGCSLADTVHLVYYKGPDIYVPNAFTPNGDGVNDVLRPLPVDITLTFFSVFDRWGNAVFETKTYLAGWDGNIKDTKAPAGTYIYEITGKNNAGKTVIKKGTVLLIR